MKAIETKIITISNTISDLEKVIQKIAGSRLKLTSTFCSKHLDYNNVQVFKLFKIILFVTRSILFYDNRKPYANIIPKSSLQAKLEF